MKISELNELFDKWQSIKQQQKDLEALEKAIKAQLEQAIPDNDRKGKIFKQVRVGSTVSYAKAIDSFRETVSKSVQEKLDQAIAEHTKETKRVYLKEVD